MKKIIILLTLLIGIVWANTGGGGGKAPTTTAQELKKILPNDDQVVNGTCSWKCRSVSGGYVTQISGFDFKSGTTYCRIYSRENLDEPLIYNANQQNLGCVKQLTQNIEKSAKSSEFNAIKDQNIQIESKIAYEPNQDNITMSKFLSALVTLNPDIIDREMTKNLGELKLKDGLEVATKKTISSNAKYDPFEKVSDYITAPFKNVFSVLSGKKDTNLSLNTFYMDDSYQKTSATDGFNKNNMAYFSDLFVNMEKVYQHLQILLFIVVGGFYLSSIGANKLQIYLENRGESAGNQPYLHKFYIPLLMVGTFFMPIPEANGLAHSTIMQNTIRYFTMKSVEVADIASAVGGKTYMDKIYKSLGGVNPQAFNYLLQEFEVNKLKMQEGEKIYKQTCSKRYEKPASNKNSIGYLKMSDKEKEEALEKAQTDRQQVAGTEYDITLDACLYLEDQINSAMLDNKRIEKQIEGIIDFYKGNEVRTQITGLDAYFTEREKQLGWINSLLTPSSAILSELISFKENSIYETDMESNTKQNQKTLKKSLETNDVDTSELDNLKVGIVDGPIAFISGRLVWLMLPGASQIKTFFDTLYDKIKDILLGFVAAIASIKTSIVGGIVVGMLGDTLLNLGKTPIVYYVTSLIIEYTFEKVPLLVCTTASAIACVSYLVSLCKYFYISPFVVAFALATKRMNKIVDFLVAGIAIFFKPILIVLFIYLALFINVLINELFIFFSVEQFSAVSSGATPLTIFTANAICGLLKIFGALATSYITWKLIVSGPSWAMSMVGIDGKQDDMISQGIEANLARRAFVA